MNRVTLPTYREVQVPAGASIVMKTDLEGRITHASPDFQRLSGYRDTDLVGSCETLLRHPDMPDEVYADLWRDVGRGRPWSAALKCMGRNGDHFWIIADVVPIEQRGVVAGFMWSGRRALRYEIDRAEFGYRRLREKNPGGPVMLHGRVVSNRFLGRLTVWYRDQSVSGKLLLNGAVAAIAVIALGLAGRRTDDGVPGDFLEATAGASTSLTMLGALVLFAIDIVFVTRRLVSRPLHEAGNAIRMMAEGNFHGRVDSRRNDEVGRLLQNVKKLQIRMGYDIERMVFGAVHRQTAPALNRPPRAYPVVEERAGERDSVPAMQRRSLAEPAARTEGSRGEAQVAAAIEAPQTPANVAQGAVETVSTPRRARLKVTAPVPKVKRRAGARTSLQDEWIGL